MFQSLYQFQFRMQPLWIVIPGPYFQVQQLPHAPALSILKASPHVHTPQNPLPPPTQKQVLQALQLPEKLILDRTDLLQAGYDSPFKTWSEEEDQILLWWRDKKKLEWEEVASKLPGRNPKMCYSRHKRIKNSPPTKWYHKDDEMLTKLVQEYGEDWEIIGEQMPSWKPKQIKDRYDNYLRPGISNPEWTLEEDLLLIDFLNKKGKDWAEAERLLPGRSISRIKSRYYGRFKKLNDAKLSAQKHQKDPHDSSDQQ